MWQGVRPPFFANPSQPRIYKNFNPKLIPTPSVNVSNEYFLNPSVQLLADSGQSTKLCLPQLVCQAAALCAIWLGQYPHLLSDLNPYLPLENGDWLTQATETSHNRAPVPFFK